MVKKLIAILVIILVVSSYAFTGSWLATLIIFIVSAVSVFWAWIQFSLDPTREKQKQELMAKMSAKHQRDTQDNPTLR